MTLRTRLVLGLLASALIGLTVAGAITYHEQRSYLLQRVKEQLASALVAPQQLDDSVVATGRQGKTRPLPPGTYAELRYLDDGSVQVISGAMLENGAKPALPDNVVVGQVFTVHHPSFRVGAARVGVGPGPFTRPAVLVVAIPLRDVSDALHRLLLVELVVAGLVLIALAGLGWYVVALGLKPLRQMQTTAGKIAAGDLSQRVDVVGESTEVGQLGLALNEMLQQIERAFAERAESEERLRRFVGDASHELRTPLTSIRGYAELFRRGAADRPEDLAKAMRRIEEEANRMGVLVDDLLLLARLDQGRPLVREPVDLTRITGDAVDDARATAPGRVFDFAPDGAVVVSGDEVRLRQVLGNLLQNAIRHTPAESPVHVQVIGGPSEAVIEVRDEGPGMPTDDAAHVFERFWRSDGSRQRRSGGTGLGLAIVAAIADAHGGSAEVETAPGAGATFRVHLPRTIPAADPPDPDQIADVRLAELEDHT